MTKRKLVLVAISLFLLLGFSIAYGATPSTGVQVTLPTFTVSLNGTKVESYYREYPLIVYKEITYFPMTYNDCRYLGLESKWQGGQKGLFIDTSDIAAAYDPYRTEIQNKFSTIATIPAFPITINEKTIDNSKEEYPLLLFRGITYFPLTWRFAEEEFGWQYSFDLMNGLAIDSHNTQLLQISIPKDRDENWEVMAIAGGHIYYLGTEGRIMQTEIFSSNRQETHVEIIAAPLGKMVYQLPLNYLGDGTNYVFPQLYSEEGVAYLTYYMGSPTMGTEFLVRLNGEEATVINSSRNVRKAFDDKEFMWWIGAAPGSGNLYMKTDDPLDPVVAGYEGWKKIGNPDYLYGWNWRIYDADDRGSAGQGGSGSTDCYLVRDELYILAFDTKQAAEYVKNSGVKPTTGLYRVNILTNETQRISEEEVSSFKIEGDSIYYNNQYVELFEYKISEEREYPLQPKLEQGNNYIARFEVLGGRVYFESGVDHGLYNSDYQTLGMGVQELKITGTNREYLACTLSGIEQCPDRIMIYDANGGKIFRSSDEAYAITVEGNKVYYFNKNTNTVCVGEIFP